MKREKKWWMDAVVYQIYPRSFKDSNGDGVGDIPGIIEKLGYLKELGIDVIWLSPVYDSPNDDNGYDIRDYEAINHEFGTMADMDKLIEQVHAIGIKIVMDLVVNHTSDEHPWFVEARSSKDNPKRDFYIWREGKPNGPPTNWGSVFGGSAWEYNPKADDYYLHLFSKKQPDLNWENPTLRKAVYDMMNHWAEKGIDGFRMDVINFISKDQRYPDGVKGEGQLYGDGSPYFMNGPQIHEFLQEIHHNVLEGRDLMTVGEAPGVSVEDAKLYTGQDRHEVSMVFHFEHMGLGDGPHGKWDNLPWKLTDLKRIMAKWQVDLGSGGWNSLYWNNHDQPRVVSRFGNDGKYRVKSAKMLATCLHMMKGTPYIYQGEEIGMTNIPFSKIEDYRDIETLNRYDEAVRLRGEDPEAVMKSIQARGRDNARTPMQWDDSNSASFTMGEPWIAVNPNFQEINVAAALDNPKSIFYHYQKLISLRHQHEIIKYGDFELLLPDDEKIFAYLRKYEGKTWLVICNFSDEVIPFEMPASFEPKSAKLILSGGGVVWPCLSSINHLELRPYDSFVFDVLF